MKLLSCVAHPAVLAALLLVASACRPPLPGALCRDNSDCPVGLVCDTDYSFCYRPEDSDAQIVDAAGADTAVDAGRPDSAAQDAPGVDQGGADVLGADAPALDSSGPDSSGADGALADTGASADVLPSDAQGLDTSPLDAAHVDTVHTDTWAPDSAGDAAAAADVAALDTGAADGVGPDVSTPDAVGPDTGAPDVPAADASQPDTGTGCPKNQIYFDGSCYLHPAGTAVHWRAAWSQCQSLGMHLVSVDSATEQTFVLTGLGAFETNYIWLDLNDMTTEGDFVTYAGGHPAFVEWGGVEPNDHTPTGEGEDCVVMRSDSGAFYDYPCRSLVATGDIVCEKALAVDPPICGNSTPEPGEACDDGNTVDGDQCNAVCTIDCTIGITDNLSCYWLGPDAVDWDTGRTYCQAVGLDYVAINSQAENDFIRANFRDGYASPNGRWIGFTEEGSGWKWTNGDETVWNAWATDEPAIAPGSAYMLDSAVNADGEWASDDGTASRRPVCENL